MSVESMNEATERLQNHLTAKNPKTPAGFIRAIETFRNQSSDPDDGNVAESMINYYKRIDLDQKFSKFAKQKAKNIRLTTNDLTRDQWIKFRQDFEKLEEGK